MGHDPRASVLDPHNRCWDSDNLFVVDGACFASQGPQNPTLTMMALALRASEHIVALSRRHEI
jgi:choline dehydrogenase-like flavoprotein